MKQFWTLVQRLNDYNFEIAHFLDLSLAQEARDTLRQKYMDVYLATNERKEAWETRPKYQYTPTYDEYGIKMYDRAEAIEDSLCELELMLESIELEEHDIIETLDELKFDCYYKTILDDDRIENQRKLEIDRLRERSRKRQAYEESRKDKPKGIAAI